MPDGTILDGIPDGTSKADIMAKYSNMQEASPQQYLDQVNDSLGLPRNDTAVMKDEYMTQEEFDASGLTEATGQQYVDQANKMAKKKWGNRKDYSVDTSDIKYDMRAADVIMSPEQRAKITGPAAEMRLKDAREMGFMDRFNIAAGRETNKLIEGTKDLGNTIGGVISVANEALLPKAYIDKANELTGGLYDPQTYINRSIASKRANEEENRLTNEFQETSGIADLAGGALPYALSELATGPLSAKMVKGAGNLVSEMALKGTQKVGKEASRFQKYMATSEMEPLRKAGITFKKMVQDPITELGQKYIGREGYGNPNLQGAVKDVLAGGLSGAVEGGLHQDNSIIGGATSGIAGGLTGVALTPYLSKKYNANTAAERLTIQKIKKEKIRVSPGIDIKNRELQAMEQGFRNNDITSEMMSRFDAGNQKQYNRIAYEAMGVDPKKVGDFTPRDFDKHLKGISNQYENLVNNTRGKLSKTDNAVMNNHFNTIINKPYVDPGLVKKMRGYQEELKKMTGPSRDPKTGKMNPWTFDGKTYQIIRRDLKNELSKAAQDGNKETMDAIRPVLNSLDNGIDKGIAAGNKVTSKQWKDLNEKNAMAEILINDGMDVHGNVDTQKLLNHFESKDMKRMITGRAGESARVDKLHTLAKYRALENQSAGSPLSGANLHDPNNKGKMSIANKALFSKFGKSISPVQSTALKTYMAGYPNQYGLLGMNRFEGKWKPGSITRPLSQSGQLWPTLYDKYQGANQNIEDLKSWYEEKKKQLSGG